MLVIHPPQWARLNQLMSDRLQQRLAALLSDRLPQLVAEPDPDAPRAPDASDSLGRLVDRGRERAALLGMTDDDDVAVIVTLLAADGCMDPLEQTRFREWVTPGLERPETAGKVRLALAERQLGQAASRDPLAAHLREHIAAARQHFGPAGA